MGRSSRDAYGDFYTYRVSLDAAPAYCTQRPTLDKAGKLTAMRSKRDRTDARYVVLFRREIEVQVYVHGKKVVDHGLPLPVAVAIEPPPKVMRVQDTPAGPPPTVDLMVPFEGRRTFEIVWNGATDRGSLRRFMAPGGRA